MVKIAGVVILYYPDQSIISNIASYSNFIEKLYIVDNSEQSNQQLIQEITSARTNYIHDGINQGIAFRLNQVAKLAIQEGFHFLLTMDQDSAFENEAIRQYVQCIAAYKEKETIAMFGIEYIEKHAATTDCSGLEVEKLITSGSMVNLDLFEQTGGFDEALFIDEVDLEYCYRAITKGYKIIQFKNIFLQHSLGHTTMHRSLKTLKATPRALHSPIRVYYMVRNYLYVNKKYKNRFIQDTRFRKKALLNRVKNNLLYGKQKFRLLKYILTAIADYNKGRMGKKSF